MVVSLKSVMDLENLQNSQEHNEVPSPWYMTYKESISVLVRNPIVHYSWNNGHYTSYAINIETNHIAFTLKHSVSRRRYSEFVYLRQLLKQQHPTLTPPSLPPKTFFNNASTAFLEKRRLGLQDFLQRLMEVPMFVSNRAMHLFVQSSYPMHKIANMTILTRQDHSDDIEPHLSLSHLFPEEDAIMHFYNTDVPDFDILGSLYNYSHNHGYSSPRQNSFSQAICTRCGLPRSQIHLTQGNQITLRQPVITFPASDICDGHSPPVEILDSEYNSSINTASLNSNTPCSSGVVQSLEVKHIPKKKVSFSSEVTVAQILSHDNN